MELWYQMELIFESSPKGSVTDVIIVEQETKANLRARANRYVSAGGQVLFKTLISNIAVPEHSSTNVLVAQPGCLAPISIAPSNVIQAFRIEPPH